MNDLDSDIVNELLKFAEMIQIIWTTWDDSTYTEVIGIGIWQMENGIFNIKKCKLMHISRPLRTDKANIIIIVIIWTLKQSKIGIGQGLWTDRISSQLGLRGVARNLFWGYKSFGGIKLYNSRSDVIFTQWKVYLDWFGGGGIGLPIPPSLRPC